ncbi:hydantoinase B/oxoprolinase family protein [Halegenticoccus tardaugens]|uniref:hydantoinase B/oxoprolinase family protein n=1 Tax=Halegenticoccus tardaugens TaxID=2071624 RepID=UPI001E5BACAA|nr:hydantoinase B/oxoprolinase family protein [Halegenticoccus tardaugens]
MSQQMSVDIDPATVEVVRNYLTSAATEMQRTLIRTAYNTIVYEILDFGISVYDADLNLIADSPGLALFLGANDYGLKKGVEHVGEENLDPGDVVLLNYPYWSGTHTLDVLVFAPVFDEAGEELLGYTTCRAHWLDLGAKDSGYVLDSTDVHQEGLIFPGTKVYKQGEPDEEILELIRYNSRIPDKVMGDLNAQIAAINTGKQRIRELHERYGTETVDTAVKEILDHGERTATEAVSELPDGTWSAVDYADGTPSNDRDSDDLIRLEAEVTIDGEEFSVDFSGSADEVNEPLNIPFGMTETIAKLCFKSITTPDEDSNEGQYEPLSVVAPEGNIFHATYPAPTFTIWTGIVGIDVVYKALAKAVPDMIPAASGGDLCDIMVFGENPETGQQFVEALNEGVGWGAAPNHDGANALMHISETMVQNVPIEVYENKAPLEISELKLRQDSGGAGKYRGGLGIQRDYEFTHSVGALSIVQKTKTDNWGLDCGEPGARNAVVLYPGTEKEEWTGMMRETFAAGEGLSNRSGGGAGRGNPFERDPEAVREDVIDEYVSREAAREEYGVAITEDGEIDESETESLRS